MTLRVVDPDETPVKEGQVLREAFEAAKRLEESPELPREITGAVIAFVNMLEHHVDDLDDD